MAGKRRPWQSWALLPPKRCAECKKMLPDLIKRDGGWRRPEPRTYCSTKCAGAAMRAGSRHWFEKHRKHLDYDDFC